MIQHNAKHFHPPAIISTLLLSWLFAVTIEYFLKPGPLYDLSTVAGMNLSHVLIFTFGLMSVLLWVKTRLSHAPLRWMFTVVVLLLCIASLSLSFTPAFLVSCVILVLISINYAIRGWNSDSLPCSYSENESKASIWIAAGIAILFFIFVSIWTVCRVYTFSAPTYDFGIFSQMFYNMKQTGLPLTTLERDGLLSHFKVHMSPIYYLLLPFYCIIPTPATLQVLQAAILASSVIPLWQLCKKYGLHPFIRVLLCLLLFLYPAYSGGTSYDIHENAFLTPLLFWLFYAIDAKKPFWIGLFTLLILMVKEDAAVYTAVIGSFLTVYGLIRKDERRTSITGILILLLSIIWFLIVTAYLSRMGDGVMTYRYDNFIYDRSGSLFTVIKAALMCPMKVLYECTDTEKIKFIIYTMLPLLGIPFFTRRYERYILLIPYLLVNLMSDYQYQHSIFFQYTFGSTAFLFYLVIVNLADVKDIHFKFLIPATAVIVSIICFVHTVLPVATQYPERYQANQSSYRQTQQVLDMIPDEASVAATTFFTVPLSQRSNLYDIRYTSKETVLTCEYVVLTTSSQSCYEKYATDSNNGFDALVALLLESDFTLHAQLDGVLQIYRKA